VHKLVRSFPLDELKPDAAAAMFRERLTRDGLDQECDADVARLYQVVGGNPLAMEWIVGQLREGSQLPYVLSQLKKGKANILDNVFAHAWARLDENCRAVMKALPVFVRPVLEATLRATSGCDEDTFHEGLRTLTRLYLVKRLRLQEGPTAELTGRRYFVHPFTRDFLEAQSSSDETRTIVTRAASYYVDYVTTRGGTPDKEESAEIAELNSERENILGTVDACATVSDQGTAVRLVQAAARWLFIESHWNDLVRYGERAAEEAVALGEPHAAARILAEVGRSYSYRSELALADSTFARALTLARVEPPDKWAVAYLQHHIGERLARQRKYREAETELEQSLAGFEAVQDTRAVIGVRYRMAMLAYDTNAIDQARELATRGVRETLAAQWKRLEGFNRRLLGDVAISRNDVPEARYQYQLALELVPRTDMRMQALLELSLARLDRAEGAASAARSRAKIALGHFEKLSMHQEAEEARRLAAGLVPTAP
jgi:tetratricopeptide (TPR) repeat protein